MSDTDNSFNNVQVSDLREALESGEFDGGHALIIKDDFWRERITGWKADSDRARDPITDEEVERPARELHRRWIEESLNPDDPDDTYYPELWDEMEEEDRDWFLTAVRLVLEAFLNGRWPDR